MGVRVVAVIGLQTVLIGWIPHFMFPDHYQAFQWLLSGVNVLIILPLLARRWTDGVGHLGAWGGVLLRGHIFLPDAR